MPSTMATSTLAHTLHLDQKQSLNLIALKPQIDGKANLGGGLLCTIILCILQIILMTKI